MSLAPPIVQSPLNSAVEATRRSCYDFVLRAAELVTANIKGCWASPDYTPQQFLDAIGDQAAGAMTLNGQLVQLILGYQQLTGVTVLDDSVLALVGNFTANNDGTVTVNA